MSVRRTWLSSSCGSKGVGDGLAGQVDLVVAQARVHRARQQLLADPSAPTEALTGDGAHLPEPPEVVHGDEVHGRGDVTGCKPGLDLVTQAAPDADGVQVPGVGSFVVARTVRQPDRIEPGQPGVVPGGQLL